MRRATQFLVLAVVLCGLGAWAVAQSTTQTQQKKQGSATGDSTAAGSQTDDATQTSGGTDTSGSSTIKRKQQKKTKENDNDVQPGGTTGIGSQASENGNSSTLQVKGGTTPSGSATCCADLNGDGHDDVMKEKVVIHHEGMVVGEPTGEDAKRKNITINLFDKTKSPDGTQQTSPPIGDMNHDGMPDAMQQKGGAQGNHKDTVEYKDPEDMTTRKSKSSTASPTNPAFQDNGNSGSMPTNQTVNKGNDHADQNPLYEHNSTVAAPAGKGVSYGDHVVKPDMMRMPGGEDGAPKEEVTAQPINGRKIEDGTVQSPGSTGSTGTGQQGQAGLMTRKAGMDQKGVTADNENPKETVSGGIAVKKQGSPSSSTITSRKAGMDQKGVAVSDENPKETVTGVATGEENPKETVTDAERKKMPGKMKSGQITLTRGSAVSGEDGSPKETVTGASDQQRLKNPGDYNQSTKFSVEISGKEGTTGSGTPGKTVTGPVTSSRKDMLTGDEAPKETVTQGDSNSSSARHSGRANHSDMTFSRGDEAPKETVTGAATGGENPKETVTATDTAKPTKHTATTSTGDEAPKETVTQDKTPPSKDMWCGTTNHLRTCKPGETPVASGTPVVTNSNGRSEDPSIIKRKKSTSSTKDEAAADDSTGTGDDSSTTGSSTGSTVKKPK